jgi:5,6,7,8-tetrahydromethanopterin hydro-lyase
VVVLKPSLPVKPLTLFVTKAAPANDTHGTMIWGAAQAGVAGGVADAVAEGYIKKGDLDDSVIITAVWVNPGADDADAVYHNNREATRTALMNGAKNLPSIDEVLDNRALPHNPYYTAKD